MDMTTTRAHRGPFPQTLSHNYMRIIRRMRGYKNIPKKDGTLKSHVMAYSQSLVYIIIYIYIYIYIYVLTLYTSAVQLFIMKLNSI